MYIAQIYPQPTFFISLVNRSKIYIFLISLDWLSLPIFIIQDFNIYFAKCVLVRLTISRNSD